MDIVFHISRDTKRKEIYVSGNTQALEEFYLNKE